VLTRSHSFSLVLADARQFKNLVLTDSYSFSPVLTRSERRWFSVVLTTRSHSFSLVLTRSHSFSLVLADSQFSLVLADSHSFSLVLTRSRWFLRVPLVTLHLNRPPDPHLGPNWRERVGRAPCAQLLKNRPGLPRPPHVARFVSLCPVHADSHVVADWFSFSRVPSVALTRSPWFFFNPCALTQQFSHSDTDPRILSWILSPFHRRFAKLKLLPFQSIFSNAELWIVLERSVTSLENPNIVQLSY
jgi:hypothetical protein